MTSRKCERCGEPLVEDRAGFSADGRVVCTRGGCQMVEETNRRILEGSYRIMTIEEWNEEREMPRG